MSDAQCTMLVRLLSLAFSALVSARDCTLGIPCVLHVQTRPTISSKRNGLIVNAEVVEANGTAERCAGDTGADFMFADGHSIRP